MSTKAQAATAAAQAAAATAALKKEVKKVAKKEKSLAKQEAKVVRKGAQASGKAVAVNKLMARLPNNGGVNPYLLTLLDPEATGPQDYPDMFSLKTAKAQFVFDKKVPIDSSDGSFLIAVHPTLKNHVMLKTPVAAASVTFQGQGWYEQPYVTTPDGGQKIVPVGTTFTDVKVPPAFTLSTDPTQVLKTEDEKIFLPTRTGSTVFTLSALSFWLSTAAGGDSNWQIVDSLGNVYTPTTSVATVTNTAATWVKIQVKYSTQDFLKALLFTSVTIATQTGGSVNQWYDCTDFSALDPTIVGADVYESYRVVSMSTLLSFHGDELYNGGDVAARYIEGGESPSDLGWIDYASLASAPQSFDGPLKTGAYCIWKPQAVDDMNFRDIDQSNMEGILPSILIAGVQSTSLTGGATTNLRLRVVMNIEAKTGRCFIPTSISRVSLQEIQAANIALSGIKLCMENPLHLEKIRQFIRSVYQKGQSAYQALQPYMPIIKPIATGAASLLFPELAPAFAGASALSSVLGK